MVARRHELVIDLMTAGGLGRTIDLFAARSADPVAAAL
jgi:hypothetical protein